MNHPVVIESRGTELVVPKTTVLRLNTKGPKAILWCNEGLYGWIPVEKVINALQEQKDKEKLKTSIPLDLKFQWADVVEIPIEAGKAIKKYNGGKNVQNNKR